MDSLREEVKELRSKIGRLEDKIGRLEEKIVAVERDGKEGELYLVLNRQLANLQQQLAELWKKENILMEQSREIKSAGTNF